MTNIKINGQEIEVEKSITVLQAAEKAGIEIPHFCYHPALEQVGSCRLCQVEFKAPGRPHLGISCRTYVVEGMEVETHSEAAVRARAGVLEFLLANHPLDCPICDKAGECPLQNYSYEHGFDHSRFEEEKRKSVKRKRFGGHIIFDGERCVLCTRCVRFMEDYAKSPQLLVSGRGDHTMIDIFPGRELDSNYTGNLADICPVGALTLEEFRFKVRAWSLANIPSICPYCSRGCNVYLDVRKVKNRLYRVRPRTNHWVNGYFICNEGRFRPLEAASLENRLTGSMINGKECKYGAALEEAAARLKAHQGKILVVASSRRTVEELYLIQRIFGAFEDARLVASAPETEEADGILRTGENAPNVRALEAFGFEVLSLDKLSEVLTGSEASALVMLDASINMDPHMWESFEFVLFMDYVHSGVTELADVVIPGLAWFEKEGTFINFEGRVQRILPGLEPPDGDVHGDLKTLSGLFGMIHGQEIPSRPAEVFESIGASFAAFRGIDYMALGEEGNLLGEVDEGEVDHG